MKRIINQIILLLIGGFIIISCGRSAENKRNDFRKNMTEKSIAMEEPATDSVKNETSNSISSSAAVENNKDKKRKFIRTADMKFKVKNVLSATYQIEDITAKFDGFVTYTKLSTDIIQTETKKISPDSSLEVNTYVVENNIIIRVPNIKLDSVLRSFSSLIEFLNYRTIQAEDVHINIKNTELTQKRNNDYIADSKNSNTAKNVDKEYNRLNAKEKADNAVIEKMALMDKVDFSTISINIYQREEVKYELLANKDKIQSYKSSFFNRIINSISNGWRIIEELIIFVVNLWALILCGLGIYFLILFIIKRSKEKIK